MRRPFRLVIAVALVCAALVAAPTAAYADVDDFSFDSWHSDYELGISTEGYSTLNTVETIVARFPAADQNHGLTRAIPTHYEGDPTGLDVESVTDENGTPRDFEIESGDGDLELVVISADDYVHGAQTYVITYSQTHVVLSPDDSEQQEFYWDVNGTGWNQPVAEISATVTFDAAIVDALTGGTECFRGGQGSTEACGMLDRSGPGAADGGAAEADAAATTLTAAATDLAPRETLTIVAEFEAGTFTPRDGSFTATPFPGIGLGAALLGLLVLLGAIAARAMVWRHAPGRPTIIAEYLPPRGINLLQASDIAGGTAKAMAALFLSLAVRGNLRVIETDATGTKTGRKPGTKKGAAPPHYELELRGSEGVDETERGILTVLFPGLAPGTRRDLAAKDATLTAALLKVTSAVRRGMIPAGFRTHPGGALRSALLVSACAVGAVGVVASAIAGLTEIGGGWPILTLILAILSAIATVVVAGSVRPLTATGAELRDYLKGLKLYIALAEADRLRVLQSPEGALRSPGRPRPGFDGGSDPSRVLKLYERVLPYAVLFGQEKEWSSVLGTYYQGADAQPDWYVGSGSFNAAYFAVGISAFSASTTAAWSGSTASSSSSGMSGGSAGGGGGGGGGGGN
ncbi:DUF2207 domain-containing protein [Cryobacterium frigoriphilum]|uniref:DUF2207 domain-containing protein n=1 Tax=Cryobacterium frigoriphilum TaxID=1259150 RepID=A0A4R8ZYA0_9MICO|nr:DUF2207 domain-containing protein [Cryobacterium frigoriphilum]TFD48840.1 DUF2207 domain-containing protein [Cryobacterium frigoriphilum]